MSTDEKTGTLFRVDDLSVFERHGATVERREGRAGCWIKLPNGWTLSVQWSGYTYSSNHDVDPMSSDVPDATTAEIAVWHEGGSLVTWANEDTVQGWCSMERVLHVLDLLADDKLMRADDKWTEPER